MKQRVGQFEVTFNRRRYIDQVLEGKEYDFLFHYPVIVDVGANIGMFSLSMYDRADKIYALEPVKENLDCLIQTIEDNKLEKIVAVQMALSDHSFVQNMDRNGDPGEGGWRLDAAGDYPVDTRTLIDFMKSQQIEYIDLLKLDVEGEELAIISSPLFPHQKIGTIIGEYHSVILQSRTQELLEWMGYKYQDLGNSHFIARK